MTLYKKKYRVETNRLRSHAYDEGMYFVTICTQKKMQWFGEVIDKKMTLNEMGEIVKNEWLKTPTIRSYVKLDAWCVMPNHIHGIILVDNVETCGAHVSLTKVDMTNSNRITVERYRIGSLETGIIDCLETGTTEFSESGVTDFLETCATKKTCAPHVSTKKLVLQPKSLGSIINQFKGTVTKKIHAAGYPEFHWQSRFHDHIIRSDQELNAIRAYIHSNPEQWDKECIPWHADGTAWSL